MIEWMQRHKKWLVITIWISTISFIAAGMVGWGSYSFSLNRDLVARVGKIDVTQKQFQTLFGRLYNQFNTDGKLDLNQARELGLDQMALEDLIQRALVENLALDLGLRVSSQEVEKEIAKIEIFWLNGQFNFEQYKSILAQNGLRPVDFEEEIRADLLVQKALKALPFSKMELTALEKQAFNESLYIQDQLKIKLFNQKDIVIKVSEEEVQKFWEETKSNYQYPQEYKIQYVFVDGASQKPTQEELQELYEVTKSRFVDANGQIQPLEAVKEELIIQKQQELAEEKALREFVELKKAKEKYGTEVVLVEGDLKFGKEALRAIAEGQVGESIKPIALEGGFVTFKIIHKKPQTPKTYTDAKKEAKEALILASKTKELERLAKESLLKGFKGQNLGFVSTFDEKKLPLAPQEAREVLAKVFTSDKPKGMVSLGETIVVFEILNQRLMQRDKIDPKFLASNEQVIGGYKNKTVSKALFDYLRKQYKIEKFAIQ